MEMNFRRHYVPLKSHLYSTILKVNILNIQQPRPLYSFACLASTTVAVYIIYVKSKSFQSQRRFAETCAHGFVTNFQLSTQYIVINMIIVMGVIAV
jgi:hypothetical protein